LKPKQLCPVCGRASIEGWRHGRCKGEMERLVIGMRYRGLVSLGLRRVKFGSSWAVLDDLFEWWWDEVGGKLKELDKNEWIISWIPMYEKKKKRRGFDQAEILAKKLEVKSGIRMVATLERVRMTKPQFGLKEKERRENLKNAFVVRENSKELVFGRKVLLIDDIWTTGSTMKEGAKVLKRIGVKEVWGVVVAG